nr:MAG TPA: protein of unknown function (DUF4355) [Caudoviricetes sp.]
MADTTQAATVEPTPATVEPTPATVEPTPATVEPTPATVESLRAQLAAAEAAMESAQHDAWATRAAVRYGLPEALADRLQGDSEAELLEDAEKFSDLIKNGGTTGITPAKPVESVPQAPATPPTQRPASPIRGAVATPAVDAIALVQKKLAASI